MKILKIICLTMLGLLIYINPFKFDFFKDGLFIVIVILGFANLHIDTLEKKIKKQWQIQTQTKKTFLKTYTFLNICICLSPFIYSFLIKIKNYDYLLSVIFFIPFIYFFVELRKLTDLILAIDIKLKNINDNVLSFVRESEILYSFLKEKEDNKKEQKLILQTNEDVIISSIDIYDDVTRIKLGQEYFIFNENFLQNLFFILDDITKNVDRITKKDFFKTFNKNTLTNKKQEPFFNEEEFDDLITNQEKIGKYFFNTDEYYINDINKYKFKFCESCLAAKYKNKTDDDTEEYFCSPICEETEKICEKLSEEINPILNENESLQEYSQRIAKSISNASTTITTMLGVSKNWINNFAIFQNKQTGHGLAAELMNHQNEKIIDQITKNAKIVGGDNAKNGADRIVNGVEIQTKYYKTPQKTINSAFDNQGNGNYRYYTKDNKPMTLEVPKDQYDYAVKNMEEKIAQGKVPGISDPSEAKNIIKKGSVTYQEAKNYSKFCSKESLKFDAKNGAVVASTAFGISFVINTYVLYYQNQNIKEAIRQSAILAFKSGGQAFTVYMIATQVQRIELVNKFLQQVINFNFKGALGQRIAQGLALSSGKEAIKTTTAMQNAANNALRGQVVVAATMMAITSGIEIHQMMRGKISSMQCVKNIIVNSSSIAGGVAGAIITGAALGSVVPGVGNLVGGFVGGMIDGIGVSKITKNILDNYIEDDLTKKQRIFFNHIITLSTLFKLSNAEASEFSMIVDKMIQEDKNFFKDKLNASMILASSNKILKPIVVLIVSNRTKLPLHTFNKEIIAEVIDEEIEEMIN